MHSRCSINNGSRLLRLFIFERFAEEGRQSSVVHGEEMSNCMLCSSTPGTLFLERQGCECPGQGLGRSLPQGNQAGVQSWEDKGSDLTRSCGLLPAGARVRHAPGVQVVKTSGKSEFLPTRQLRQRLRPEFHLWPNLCANTLPSSARPPPPSCLHHV